MSERHPGWVNDMDAAEARLATGSLVTPATEGDGGLWAVQGRTGVRPAAGRPGGVDPGEGMRVEVRPFQATIRDGATAAGGTYLVTLDTPATVSLLASDQSRDRTDLVVAELVQPDEDNPTGFAVHALAGSYDTGEPPAVPATALALAEVAVPAGAGTVDPAGIADRRGWTCALGGVLPIADRTLLPANPYPGLYVHDLTSGVLRMYDGEAWRRFLPEDDTGWIDLPVNEAGGWGWLEDHRPQARRIGSMVWMRGWAMSPEEYQDDRVVLMVPQGMRPAMNHRFAAPSAGRDNVVDLHVGTGGELRHWDMGVQPADRWFAVATNWLVD